MLVYLYKIFRLILIIFTSSYFLGIFWYIIVHDLEVPVLKNPTDTSCIEKGNCVIEDKYKITFESKYFWTGEFDKNG